jgi:hypothetical protein
MVSGCATTDPQATKTREVNSEHVSAVERVAQNAGVEIVWINPPTRVRERKFDTSLEVKPSQDE